MKHSILLRVVSLGTAIFFVGACAGSNNTAKAKPAPQTLIIDTHIDIPFRLHRSYTDVGIAAEGGDFDYPRAVAGGLNAAFMSIYIPTAADEAGNSATLADKLIDDMEALAENHPDKFAIATYSADIYAQASEGLISMPLGMENGGPVATSEDDLEHYYQRGIRYITLAHSKTNALSDSSYDLNEAHGGLSPLGREMVARMNQRGIMIDVSHIFDAAFTQVMELSEGPVIASHSSLRHFTPGFRRNMTDDMVATMAAAGGVIQINFAAALLAVRPENKPTPPVREPWLIRGKTT